MIASATIVTINSVKSFLKNFMSSYGRKRMNFYCIAEDKLKLFVLVCFHDVRIRVKVLSLACLLHTLPPVFITDTFTN
jgi:hypothetical protein